MSVYIKGRKPPNSCDDCWVSDCPNDEHIDGYRMMGRPTYCPLVPVPPHGRLIEDTAVREQIDEWLDSVGDVVVGHGLSYYGELLGCIEDAPTIIPAEEEAEV